MPANDNLEIERKFLVQGESLPPLGEGTELSQGYLSFQPSVRVRVADGRRAWLTVKGPGMIERAEYEYEIPVSDGLGLLGLCLSTLTKVRYRLLVGVHIFEIDQFTGAHAGLFLAEVELSDEHEAFEHPPWLGPEVSTDPRYTNGALARAGRAPEASSGAHP